ncbi:MAG: flagellin FliC [Halobacteriovoraceae bacterium]|nr:flagellin FliC [Halobacteriovoraceae bacterium]
MPRNLKGVYSLVNKLFNTTNSMRAIRHLRQTSQEVSASSQKLSSGSRITKASDDAAGLSIAAKMRANIGSRHQAIRNGNDAMGYMHVLEGSVQSMQDMVVRMRELTVASASDTYGDQERSMMNLEVQQLLHEIKRISDSTELFEKRISQGKKQWLEFQVDVNNKDNNRLKINLGEFAHSPMALGISNVKVDSQLRARTSMIKLDYAQKSLSESMAKLGALSSRVTSTVNNLENTQENMQAAKSRIKDADMAKETATNMAGKLKENMQVQTNNIINKGSQSLLKLLS